ncbi:MAG TPA: L-histidine N(alpha)-methyltransferase [Vicinamibacterales bacterium]|nr:L-histidine N(alpha)-methyltransferase [Vicinamibacterales bacterium]
MIPDPGLMDVAPRASNLEFAADVRRDLALRPKQLQSKYLYDALGSSLFEAICRLPWYRITRAEQRLLERQASAIVDRLRRRDGAMPRIVELGCGSGEKLVILAEALQAAGAHARVHLIDISSQALEQSERTLGRLRHISVVGHRETYEVGLRRAAADRQPQDPMLVLLLGSNIGNFDAPAARQFMGAIRGALAPGDALLLGADLVKPERELQLAYDDPLGVTAAFNRNLLVRINRELGGAFDLDGFAHVAVWNAAEQRVEMHLESRRDQEVGIRAAEITVRFARGERIWTESSYKYHPPQIERLGATAGFAVAEQWIDREAEFALTLFDC